MPRKGEKMSAEGRRRLSKARKRYFKDHPEAHQKASEAKRRADLEGILNQKDEEITHKRCSKCGEVKSVQEFSTRRFWLKCGLVSLRPESACKECVNERMRARYRQLKAEGRDPAAVQRKRYARLSEAAKAKSRQRHRERLAIKRREEERPVRGAYNGNGQAIEQPLDVAPLVEFLDEIDCPARIPGMDPRHLYALRNGERAKVTLETVDRILLALDCPGKLHELYPLENERLVGYHILDPEGVLERL